MQEIRVPFSEALDRGALQYLFALVAMQGGQIAIPWAVTGGIPPSAVLEWSTNPLTREDVLTIVDHADRTAR